jgi:hypothetical protein
MIYAEFAAREAAGESPAYEDLCVAVSRDARLLGLLDTLPAAKRQPNLLLAVGRYLGAPVTDPPAFLEFAAANWDRVRREILGRATQTNEPARCALLLPVLAALPQPLALLEVGASAGLNLFPDRYTYRYGETTVGGGAPGPVFDCVLTGIGAPQRVPDVVWRAGLDLNPLDVADPEDVAWLDALIWPEQDERRARQRAAARVAAAAPPLMVRGDLVDDLPALAARAPAGATLVVVHTMVLYQVAPERRTAFTDVVRSVGAHRIGVENPTVFDYPDLPKPPNERLHHVLTLDGRPLAWARPHGQALTWFADDIP